MLSRPQELRNIALIHGIAVAGNTRSADAILVAARKFEAFIDGSDRPETPPQDGES